MGGFQLWANLPARHKMRDPRYRGIQSAEIPEVERGRRPRARDRGQRWGTVGPVRDITVEPGVPGRDAGRGRRWTHPTPRGHTVFAYLFEGGGRFGASEKAAAARPGVLVLFDDGDEVP